MFNRVLFSNSLLPISGTWKPLLSLALTLGLIGVGVLLFSRLVVFLMAFICFLGSFGLLRAALRSYLNERTRRVDVIEVR